MMSYNIYPNLSRGHAGEDPSVPPEAPQVAYHLNVIQAKHRGLIAKKQMFKKKYNKWQYSLHS